MFQSSSASAGALMTTFAMPRDLAKKAPFATRRSIASLYAARSALALARSLPRHSGHSGLRSTSRPTASEVLLRSTVLPIGRSSMRFGGRPRGAFGAAKPALVHGPMEAHEAAALCDQFLHCDG